MPKPCFLGQSFLLLVELSCYPGYVLGNRVCNCCYDDLCLNFELPLSAGFNV